MWFRRCRHKRWSCHSCQIVIRVRWTRWWHPRPHWPNDSSLWRRTRLHLGSWARCSLSAQPFQINGRIWADDGIRFRSINIWAIYYKNHPISITVEWRTVIHCSRHSYMSKVHVNHKTFAQRIKDNTHLLWRYVLFRVETFSWDVYLGFGRETEGCLIRNRLGVMCPAFVSNDCRYSEHWLSLIYLDHLMVDT